MKLRGDWARSSFAALIAPTASPDMSKRSMRAAGVSRAAIRRVYRPPFDDSAQAARVRGLHPQTRNSHPNLHERLAP
jgi:hypothetical protein